MSKSDTLAKRSKAGREKKQSQQKKEFERLKTEVMALLEQRADDGYDSIMFDDNNNSEMYQAMMQYDLDVFLASPENNFTVVKDIRSVIVSWQEDPEPIPEPVIAPVDKPIVEPVVTPEPEPIEVPEPVVEEPKPVAEPEPTPEPVIEPVPEPKPEPKPVPTPKPKPEPEPKPKV